MIFTIKCTGNDFYYKNTLDNDFYNKNVLEMISTINVHLKWFLP